MAKKVEKYDSLEQVRDALTVVDEARMLEALSDLEIEALEKSALALRDAERALIKKEQKEIAEDLAVMEAELKALSKEIRTKVTSMNKVSKALDITEKVLKEVLNVLRLVGKF